MEANNSRERLKKAREELEFLRKLLTKSEKEAESKSPFLQEFFGSQARRLREQVEAKEREVQGLTPRKGGKRGRKV